MVSGLSWATSLPVRFELPRDSAGQLIAHVRNCSVDTELIDGDDRAKNHFTGVVVATRVYEQFSFSVAFQISSFQRIGSTEYRVSAFTVRMSSVPLLP